MNLCSIPLRLQYEMANKKALRFLTEGVISLTETIALWDEMRQLFFNLLKNDYATEEWTSGQITLALGGFNTWLLRTISTPVASK